MHSPFPGMDPYLENRALWREFHTLLITACAALLQPRLLERGYRVSVEGRVWLEDPDRPVYPDVSVWEKPRMESIPAPGPAEEPADSPVLVRIPRVKVRERFLMIRTIGDKRLVTGIEVISPANKEHYKARPLYLRKRKELRAGRVNIVEIDLLRAGKSVVAVSREALESKQPDDYIVNVIRAGNRFFEVYPVPLRSRLPRIRIPLSKGEPDAVLDLQAALERAYTDGGFHAEIDYTREPSPRLSPENGAWAAAILMERGLRKPDPLS